MAAKKKKAVAQPQPAAVIAKPLNNPNGANQYRPDPRQALFLAYYKDPQSPTFSNALQSALKAGFSQKYASNITDEMPEWLRENLGTSPLLAKAERNLSELLDLPNQIQAMGAFGPLFETKKTKVKKKFKNGKTKEVTVKERIPVMVHATGLLKIKNDVSQFVAERAGRAKWGDEGKGSNKTLVLVISGESAGRYGVQPTQHTEAGSE